MGVKIIVDSSADLAPEYAKQVQTVPMTLTFGADEYVDGITISKDDFYKKLENCDILPKTSQVPPVEFEKVFSQVSRAGETAVVITAASELSGTWQNACLVAEDYPGIYVVDSHNASVGAGILAEYAIQCVQRGMQAKELALHLNEVSNEIFVIARLDTLEYLKKGGRISKTAALAAGALNIKPVIGLEDGQIVVLGKARGSKKANNLLVEKVAAEGIDFSRPVLLGYTGLSDALLQEYVRSSRRLWEGRTDKLEQTQIGSIIGTHAGPGTVAVAFFTK